METAETREPDSGRLGASFRDPSGFVFRRDGRILRQVNRVYQTDYDRLMDSGLYQELVDAGLLIPHAEVDEEPEIEAPAYKLLEPERLSFISYPYEWSFSQLKEANFQVAAAEASFQGAQQNLLLRVAQAYFNILSAADQLATNVAERDAFSTLLNQAKSREQTGVGPRSDVDQAQAFYDATEQSVIDARNALDDANLAMTQIVGQHVEVVAPLREDIPLVAPEPANNRSCSAMAAASPRNGPPQVTS